jgi:hypothetical protein
LNNRDLVVLVRVRESDLKSEYKWGEMRGVERNLGKVRLD